MGGKKILGNVIYLSIKKHGGDFTSIFPPGGNIFVRFVLPILANCVIENPNLSETWVKVN
jgi:hypothetical protein